MDRFKFLILLLYSFLLAQYCYAQPCGSCNKKKHFRFELLKEQPLSIDTQQVKTTGVYLVKDTTVRNTVEYYFLRFFPNGRYYHSCLYCSPPSIENLNNLRYGSYGYYRVSKDRVIVETYSGAARYYYMYYDIKPGELILANTRSRSAKRVEFAPHIKNIFYPAILTSASFW